VNDPVVENLILDLLEWLAVRDRSYEEVMEAWRTSCPKLPVWEEANDRGLVSSVEANENRVIRPTSAGYKLMQKRRPKQEQRIDPIQETQPTRKTKGGHCWPPLLRIVTGSGVRRP